MLTTLRTERLSDGALRYAAGHPTGLTTGLTRLKM